MCAGGGIRRWGTDQERLEVACWARGLLVPLAGMAAPTPVLQGEGSSPWVLDTCPLTCGSPEVRGEEGEVAEGGGGLDEAVSGRCPPQACFSMARDVPPSVSKRTSFPRERSRASWPVAPFSRWRSDRGCGAARGPGIGGVCLHTWRGVPGRWECCPGSLWVLSQRPSRDQLIPSHQSLTPSPHPR